MSDLTPKSTETAIPLHAAMPTIPSITTCIGMESPPTVRFGDLSHEMLHAFTATFCPSVQGSERQLLQPCAESYSEPIFFALLGQHIFSFVATDPDTMPLKEAMVQPDREQFVQVMHK